VRLIAGGYRCCATCTMSSPNFFPADAISLSQFADSTLVYVIIIITITIIVIVIITTYYHKNYYFCYF